MMVDINFGSQFQFSKKFSLFWHFLNSTVGFELDTLGSGYAEYFHIKTNYFITPQFDLP